MSNLNVEGVTSIFMTGVLTGLALIAAIGAQAAFVLRQGIRREYIGTVVALCIIFDCFLITVGVAGVGAFVSGNDILLATLKYGGAAYLLVFAAQSFRSALNPRGIEAVAGNVGVSGAVDSGRSRMAVVTATAAITFLNPHVYLDSVLMLGNIANQYPGMGRWAFGGGAIMASVIWFLGIGFGAKKMAPYLAKPYVWRGIDIAVGGIMVGIAGMLVFTH